MLRRVLCDVAKEEEAYSTEGEFKTAWVSMPLHTRLLRGKTSVRSRTARTPFILMPACTRRHHTLALEDQRESREQRAENREQRGENREQGPYGVWTGESVENSMLPLFFKWKSLRCEGM
jgi:hypothetical protein